MSGALHHDRRQVLKVVIGGVATALVLPSQWSKPLISSIVAPAHAAASGPSTTKPGTTPGTTPATTTPKPTTTHKPTTTPYATTTPKPTTTPYATTTPKPTTTSPKPRW